MLSKQAHYIKVHDDEYEEENDAIVLSHNSAVSTAISLKNHGGAPRILGTERRRTRRAHLADAIDEVAEEEARGADQELLPPGPVREAHAEERPPLLLRSGHGAGASSSFPLYPSPRRMKEGSGQWPHARAPGSAG
jgi:hypothetical protein